MPSSTITRRLYTAEMRPDLWQFLDDPGHPLNKAWPYFLDQDGTQKHLSTRLCDFVSLRKFQCVVVEYNTETGEEELIACSRSIPFYWDELDELGPSNGLDTHPGIAHTLPDGGWDTIVARGIRQYMETHPDEASSWPWSSPPVMTLDQKLDRLRSSNSKPPNTLCALSITLRADRRQMGLAERMIEEMKQTARREKLRVVVVPLRPTRKSAHPNVPMEEYVTWTQATKTEMPYGHDPLRLAFPSSEWETIGDACGDNALPFDPWLRKHVRLGGKIVKIAPRSMVVEGTLEDWKNWTGIDFTLFSKDANYAQGRSKRGCLEIHVPGGLVGVKIYPRKQKAVYMEPNIWVYHEID